jgi:hypothetical protein
MTPTNHDASGGHHYTDVEMHNEDVAHEHSDINLRSILAFGIGLAVVVVTAALLMWIMFQALKSQAAARDPQLSPVAAPSDLQTAAPRLLTNEPAYLRNFRDEEAKKLEGYGWVDERGGIAHVPIEEAKKLLVQHGLPVRATGTVDDPRTGTHAPAYGEASGGRAIAIPKASAAVTQTSPLQSPPSQAPTPEVKK